MKVGVAGLGGLGHMGVKIATAMGAEVTVLTRSENKRETAMAMGAKAVVITTDKAAMANAAQSLHMIYDSISATHDVNEYVERTCSLASTTPLPCRYSYC